MSPQHLEHKVCLQVCLVQAWASVWATYLGTSLFIALRCTILIRTPALRATCDVHTTACSPNCQEFYAQLLLPNGMFQTRMGTYGSLCYGSVWYTLDVYVLVTQVRERKSRVSGMSTTKAAVLIPQISLATEMSTGVKYYLRKYSKAQLCVL